MNRQSRIQWLKFIFRILVLLVLLWLAASRPEEWSGETSVLEGMNFFHRWSVLHLLWLLYLWFMLEKLLPALTGRPRGCQKFRKKEFLPTAAYIKWKQEGSPKTADNSFWRQYQKEQSVSRRGAILVLSAWLFAIAIVAGLRALQQTGRLAPAWLDNRILLIASALFYIGELICLNLWCPFRDIFMKNRCCTQCRIYNWDAGMLVVPLLFLKGFYSYSLLAAAVLVVGCWEWNHLFHRERFYPASNARLQCGNCTGELGCKRQRPS